MATPQSTGDETIGQTFTRWLSDGSTWIGVFENKDLGHQELGRRVAFPYDMNMFGQATLNETRAPDHPQIGLGGRYYLIAKCVLVAEALAALGAPEAPAPLGSRFILPAGVPSVDQVLNLYRALTGREPGPEDRAEVAALFAAGHPGVNLRAEPTHGPSAEPTGNGETPLAGHLPDR